jgi:glucosamine-6-phosphate deaminase
VEVVVFDAPEAGARFAASRIARDVRAGEVRVLGIATGATPLPVYRALREEQLAGTGVEVMALDEYVGLGRNDPRSFGHYADAEVAPALGLEQGRVAVPDGLADDPEKEAAAYEARIRRLGPVDLQVLGVGANGHVGFNEPGSPESSTTRVVSLAASTRRDNAPYFGGLEHVPARAITQGVGTILRARRLLVLAWGSRKAPAVAALVDGPASNSVPASLLRSHPETLVVLDAAAASFVRGEVARISS